MEPLGYFFMAQWARCERCAVTVAIPDAEWYGGMKTSQ